MVCCPTENSGPFCNLVLPSHPVHQATTHSYSLISPASMQTGAVTGLFDGFNARQSVYSQEPLGSKIVRSVFQRGLADDHYIDNINNDSYSFNDDYKKSSALKRKHASSEESSSESAKQVRHLPMTQRKNDMPRYQSSIHPSQHHQPKPSIPLIGDTGGYSIGEFQFKRNPPRLRTQRRREQCRANQARYRRKQLNRAKMLEETVQKLHLEIPELELQRNQLVYGDQQRNWTAVVEYFHTFRFGIPMTPEGQLTLTSRQEETDMSEQLSLLRSTIAPDVILGELRGVESLVEQWRRYSSYFEDLHFQLGSIQRASDTLLTVVASLGVTVSDATLSSVFPHLLDQGEDITDKDVKAMATATSIGTKLLGQRLLLPCSICFEWDAASCRVVRLETTLNLVAPLIRVLGNVVDAAAALEHALIRPDGGIGQIKGGQMWTSVDEFS